MSRQMKQIFFFNFFDIYFVFISSQYQHQYNLLINILTAGVLKSGRKLWGFPRFTGDCASGNKKSQNGTKAEQKYDITDTCSQMILQLHDVYDPNKVDISSFVSVVQGYAWCHTADLCLCNFQINVKIKIVSGSPCGAVAAEATRTRANWVVLDK